MRVPGGNTKTSNQAAATLTLIEFVRTTFKTDSVVIKSLTVYKLFPHPGHQTCRIRQTPEIELQEKLEVENRDDEPREDSVSYLPILIADPDCTRASS